MIEVENLQKEYGNFKAVDNISFSVAQGEILGFLGPNGAGKTTTIRILSTFLAPSSGTARIAGFDISDQSAEVRRRIGYLPESPPLYEDFTVQEYLKFAAQIRGIAGRELAGKVETVMEKCSLQSVGRRVCRNDERGYPVRSR